MNERLKERIAEEWAQLDPVDPLRRLLSDVIDVLAQPAQEPVADDPTYTEQQIANACWAAEISDIKYQSLLIALQEDAEPVYSKPAQEWSWVCNECGSSEFTSALSEADLEYLACAGCGCNEFHKEGKNT